MASTLPSMQFPSSSSQLPRMYDVLINFTGEDIRKKFVSHLDSALSSVGFSTFLHEENAVKEMHIQQPIPDLCRIAIVVFTKTYSQSAWCLNQLQQIIKWHQTYSRHVLPVYYEIEPSDVRLQKGDFGKAFKATAQQTFSREQLQHGMSRWSHAFTKAANFFGWDESNYRSDAELVDKIVQTVLNLSVLSATKFPVGLQSHVENLIGTIKSRSTKVCTIGIYGIGGSGKTTLAKAIYYQIHGTFTEKCFIEDIAQVTETRERIHLQEQLLSDVLKTKAEIPSIHTGRKMIRERLYGKRVLIVLDDVNEYGLLDLWESTWFGEGTVMIITTRDKDLLSKRKVDYFYPIHEMNANESLELLSWHAFTEAKPKKEYNELAKAVVYHCGGLPLALEVIGTYLYERTKQEWNKVLLRLLRIARHGVREILKISFDRLNNQMEKDLFLDVCYFFVGKRRTYVTKILNGCGVDADSGIRVLIARSLIIVKKNNKIGMPSMLREMAVEIFREISRNEPGKKSRMWFVEGREYTLSENTLFSSQKTKVIQRLPLNLFLIRADCFEHYPLEVRDTSRVLKFVGRCEYPSKELRWISLQGFSSEYLPNAFYPRDAIAIDLKHSLLRLVWKEPQVLAGLKVLNLSHSKYLTKTPDLSRLPSLEHLILKDCPSLREVHQSIGSLSNLILLNLKDCTSLSNLPREIYKLKSLKTLILSGCSKIDLLEKDIVQMESLIALITENTVVKQVPFSIVSSKSIGYISLRGFEGLSLRPFPSIIRSWMSRTLNHLSSIHSFFMDMEDNSWDDIAPLLSSLENLRSVMVQCDTEFQLSKQVTTILVEHGVNITESGISKHHLRSSLIGVGTCNEFFNTVSASISEVLGTNESCGVLPGDNDLYWLAHMGEGHSVYFTVPEDRDMMGMALGVVYLSVPEILATDCLTSVIIVNYTKCTLQIHKQGTVISFNDEDWRGIKSNLGRGEKVEIFMSFGEGLVVKNTAVYLICGESNNSEKVLEQKKKKLSLVRFIKKIVM